MTYDLQTLLLIEVDKMAVLASLVCGVLIWRSRREVPDRSRIILFLITLTALPIIGKVASLMMHGLDNRFVEVLPIVPTLMGLITIGLMLLYAVEVMRPNWFRWRQVLWVLLSLACVLVLAVLFKDQFTVLHSNDDIWQHIDEPNVLLRLLHEDAVWRNPDLGLEMFCQLLGTNKDYVSRCFRQNADTTFLDYVNRLRISYVTDELRRNPLQDQRDLFFNAGFRSKTTAYRNFCKYNGQSPTEFIASLSRE